MKRLLLLGTMLAWTSAASAQDSGTNAQCSSTSQGAPVIERIDVATVERPTESSAVIQLNVVASLGDDSLNYSFSGSGGSLSSDGPQATWNVDGEGPFTATIQVSAPGDSCVTYASVTFTPEELPEQE